MWAEGVEFDALDDAAGFTEGGLGGVFGELVDGDGAVLAGWGDGGEVIAATVPGEMLDCVFDRDDDGCAGVLLGGCGEGPGCGGLLFEGVFFDDFGVAPAGGEEGLGGGGGGGGEDGGDEEVDVVAAERVRFVLVWGRGGLTLLLRGLRLLFRDAISQRLQTRLGG